MLDRYLIYWLKYSQICWEIFDFTINCSNFSILLHFFFFFSLPCSGCYLLVYDNFYNFVGKKYILFCQFKWRPISCRVNYGHPLSLWNFYKNFHVILKITKISLWSFFEEYGHAWAIIPLFFRICIGITWYFLMNNQLNIFFFFFVNFKTARGCCFIHEGGNCKLAVVV